MKRGNTRPPSKPARPHLKVWMEEERREEEEEEDDPEEERRRLTCRIRRGEGVKARATSLLGLRL